MATTNKVKLPTDAAWPKAGWKHALNYQKFNSGDVFAWYEGTQLWTGIVEESKSCAVKVRDVLPGVLKT